jgi:hypothetical protein
MKSIFISVCLVLSAITLLSCSKDWPDNSVEIKCYPVYVLSYKYTMDSDYIRTDSIWPWIKGSGNHIMCEDDPRRRADLISLRKWRGEIEGKILKMCTPLYLDNGEVLQMFLEVTRCVIGDSITYPPVLKR